MLLSSDLVPHLLAPLQLEDGAVAAVCSRWADSWKATSEGRRHLRQVACDFPQDLLATQDFRMAVVKSGLVVKSGSTVRILARDMSSGTSFELPTGQGGLHIAASEQFLYATGSIDSQVHDLSEVRILTHAGTEVASYEDQDKYIICPTLAPGGLLYCVLFVEGDNEQDEIIALDAQTLQPRHRFGLSLLNCACGMLVVGEELFVCDNSNNRLQVFSLTGEHRRSITGEWKRPLGLCLVDDRLYLVEEKDDEKDDDAEDEEDEGKLVNPLQGRRTFALSLQVETLQVYTNPVEGQTFSGDLCYFDGKLLASVQDDKLACVGVVALCGW